MPEPNFDNISASSDFSIHNIPFGVHSHPQTKERNICTAIGDHLIDLSVIEHHGLFKDMLSEKMFHTGSLNYLMSKGNGTAASVRKKIQSWVSDSRSSLMSNKDVLNAVILPFARAKMLMPAEIADYTDFYSSKEHATNVGIMFRGKENALMPNWVHMPVAYHGRASSVVVSGTDVIRPKGQIKNDEEPLPKFAASRLLDFELETGFLIGKPTKLGESVSTEAAEEHIFGMVLVNDWSARDIQKWEYVPLGPFLGKNFATSISPWVVTMEALEPYRVKSPEQNPEVLDYLKAPGANAYDIQLEVLLQTDKMSTPFTICRSNLKYMYWNMKQQLAHHTVNGCSIRTGDLMASGTISGADESQFGSMLELTWRGTKPLKLPNGEERKFLQDGDTVTMRGYCEKDGKRVGFGDVKGMVLPAR